MKSRYRKTKVSRSKIRKAVKGAFSKKIILSVLILILAISLKAQSPFKRIPHPKVDYYITLNSTPFPDSIPDIIVLKSTPDTAFNAFRFLINVSSFDLSNDALLTGFSYGLQHVKWDSNLERYNEKWSIGGIIWYKSRLNSSDTLGTPLKYGLIGSFYNNLFIIGLSHDFKSNYQLKTISITLGIGLSLN